MDFGYLLRRPSVSVGGRPPLLVLLHGKGADESDLFGLAPHFDGRFVVLSVRAPHGMGAGMGAGAGAGGWRWYERVDGPEGSVYDEGEVLASRVFLLQAIKDAVMGTGADPRQVFVLGFSQGGAMALALALTAPQLLRGVVSVAGRLLPAVAPLAVGASALGHVTVLLQHGSEDAVVPASESAAACALLAELGVMQGLKLYAAGHTVTPGMLRDARAFLSAQLDALGGGGV